MNQVDYACTIPSETKNVTDTSYSGFMEAKKTGNYTIMFTYKGSFILQLNDKQVYNESKEDWESIRTKEVVIFLTEGFHYIKINYASHFEMRFQVEYTGPDVTRRFLRVQ